MNKQELDVIYSVSAAAKSLVRFNLSGLGPYGVQSAKLRLYTRTAGNVDIAVWGVSSSADEVVWAESSVTWNNFDTGNHDTGDARTMPSPWIEYATDTTGTVSADEYYEIDITTWVQQREGDTSCTLVLCPETTSGNMGFDDKDDASVGAEILVFYDSDSSSQGTSSSSVSSASSSSSSSSSVSSSSSSSTSSTSPTDEIARVYVDNLNVTTTQDYEDNVTWISSKALTGDFRVDFMLAGNNQGAPESTPDDMVFGVFSQATADATGNDDLFAFGVDTFGATAFHKHVLTTRTQVSLGAEFGFNCGDNISLRRTGSELAVYENGVLRHTHTGMSTATVYAAVTFGIATEETPQEILVCNIDGAEPDSGNAGGTGGGDDIAFAQPAKKRLTVTSTNNTAKRADLCTFLASGSPDTGDFSYKYYVPNRHLPSGGTGATVGSFDSYNGTAANNQKNFNYGINIPARGSAYSRWVGGTETTLTGVLRQPGDYIEIRRTGTTYYFYLNGETTASDSYSGAADDSWPALVHRSSGSRVCPVDFDGNTDPVAIGSGYQGGDCSLYEEDFGNAT